MGFEPSKIYLFLEKFKVWENLIRNQPGCEFLELYREKNNSNIFFTYSYWNSEKHLNEYKHSELFEKIWKETKTMFNTKPEAWSVDKISSLP